MLNAKRLTVRLPVLHELCDPVPKVRRPERRLAIETAVECHYCGRPLNRSNRTWDHKIPESRGGSDRLTNLVPVCRTCNTFKGDLLPGEWLLILERMVESVRDLLDGDACSGMRGMIAQHPFMYDFRSSRKPTSEQRRSRRVRAFLLARGCGCDNCGRPLQARDPFDDDFAHLVAQSRLACADCVDVVQAIWEVESGIGVLVDGT